MNKKLIAPIAVVIILIIGGFLFLNKSQVAVPAQTNTTNQVTDTAQKSSFLDLFKSGTNQTCVITQDQNSGTVKISGDKSRVDMTTTSESKSIETHVIASADYLYMWNSESKDGFKFKNEPAASTSTTPSEQSASKFDLNQQVDLKCTPGTVDPSVFNLPSDIKFTDLAETMKKVEGVKQGLSTSACDAITDPAAKAACISALSR